MFYKAALDTQVYCLENIILVSNLIDSFTVMVTDLLVKQKQCHSSENNAIHGKTIPFKGKQCHCATMPTTQQGDITTPKLQGP